MGDILWWIVGLIDRLNRVGRESFLKDERMANVQWTRIRLHWMWNLGLVHMRSQVPSPTHASKSWHGCRVPTFEPQEIIKMCTIIIKVGSWLFYEKIFMGLVLRFGSSILLNPTLNTSPEPHLQKALSCRYPCYTWDLGLWDMFEVINPNFHTLDN